MVGRPDDAHPTGALALDLDDRRLAVLDLAAHLLAGPLGETLAVRRLVEAVGLPSLRPGRDDHHVGQERHVVLGRRPHEHRRHRPDRRHAHHANVFPVDGPPMRVRVPT